jgi:hypothetical protein
MSDLRDYDAISLYLSWLVCPFFSAYALGILSIGTQSYCWSSAEFWVDAWVEVNLAWLMASLIVFVWRNR